MCLHVSVHAMQCAAEAVSILHEKHDFGEASRSLLSTVGSTSQLVTLPAVCDHLHTMHLESDCCYLCVYNCHCMSNNRPVTLKH